MKKKNLIRRFIDFIEESFREYNKTIQYGAAHNINLVFYEPYCVSKIYAGVCHSLLNK